MNIHQKIVDNIPALKKGQVWCRECGHTEKVDSAHCLAKGYPKHCEFTMTIDEPKK